jgi:hypothetical protein
MCIQRLSACKAKFVHDFTLATHIAKSKGLLIYMLALCCLAGQGESLSVGVWFPGKST